MLKEEFQIPDYEKELLEKIRTRSQGHNKKIGMYLAVMENLFSQLPNPPTEQEKLKIIQPNIPPYFIKRLSLHNIDILAELLVFGRQLEHSRVMAQKFKPPPVNHKELLESDLAYQGIQKREPPSVSVMDVLGHRPVVNKCGDQMT